MTVNKADIEDIEPIEEVQTELEKELTPEEKEQQESFLRAMVIRRFKPTLREIHDYMNNHNLTFGDLRNEIENKKCGLSKSRRDFIIGFKQDFIQQLLDDMYHVNKENLEHTIEGNS